MHHFGDGTNAVYFLKSVKKRNILVDLDMKYLAA